MASLYVHGGVSGLEKVDPPSLAEAFGLLGQATGGQPPTAAPPEHPSALDLVEEATRVLEDHPELNAGYGAVLDRDGCLELDAGIVDGYSGSVGAVAGVTVRHPITLARKVLEETPHALLTGEGAQNFGSAMEQLTASTDEQHARWQQAKEEGSLDLNRYGSPEHVDTVGAVALDGSGRLAAASSTGGVFGKMRGRVGDAPVFGAGIYASRRAAVIGTGVGELFLQTLACAQTGRLIEEGMDPQKACERVVELLGARERTAAGILALDHKGVMGAAYRGGSWLVEGPGGRIAATNIP
ncbi:MAG: isoaspartyl peptidase/L-asparaginase family protein [Actinomycetota bacterium]